MRRYPTEQSPAAAEYSRRASPPAEHLYYGIGAAAVATHVALTLWRVHGSYFWADDFFNLEMAREAKLDRNFVAHFLLRDIHGQVIPFYRIVNWLFVRLAALNYSAAETVLIGGSALCVACVAAIAARARTPPILMAVFTFVAALSWVTVEPDRWWSSGDFTV